MLLGLKAGIIPTCSAKAPFELEMGGEKGDLSQCLALSYVQWNRLTAFPLEPCKSQRCNSILMVLQSMISQVVSPTTDMLLELFSKFWYRVHV